MRKSLGAALLLVLVAGCSAPAGPEAPVTQPRETATTTPAPEPGRVAPVCVEQGSLGTQTCPATGLGSTPPAWLGTRVLPVDPATGNGVVRRTPPVMRDRRWTLPDTVAPLPGRGFASRIVSPAPPEVIERSSWAPGCPVAATDLAWLRVTFWGFDAQRHTGELLVNHEAARPLAQVFGTLWRDRFPMEQLGIQRAWDPDAPPLGDGNGTGSFVCRPSTGATYFSQHAYGLAIDVNAFQNPYAKRDVVLPELASSYLDRADVRPGMVVAGGPVVRAFAAIGWEWGGAWSQSKDYMHFSRNGL